MDTKGYPHISFASNELKYAFRNTLGWHIQTIDDTDVYQGFVSIILDPSGRPYIAYHRVLISDLMLAAAPIKAAYLPLGLRNYQSTPRLELHLDEAAGATSFIDASGWEHNAYCTTANCPTAGVAGVFGTALQFDGLNDSLTLGNPSGLNFNGNVTLEAWVRLQSTSGIQNILAHGYTSTPKREVFLRVNIGFYKVGSWDGSGLQYLCCHSCRRCRETGYTWQVCMMARSGGLYRNGVQVSESAQPQGALLVNAPWAVGSAGNGSERFFNGRIDEVTIYTRALSANEIRMHYEALVP